MILWQLVCATYRSDDLLACMAAGFEPFAVTSHEGFEDDIYLRRRLESEEATDDRQD